MILVADDQQAILENIKIILEVNDYQVLTATNGLEALELMKEHRVDLILADIAMPKMNGYQLYEKVRENANWNAIPFIFVTARALDSDVRYGKELGVDDYLIKPFQPEDLIAIVQGKLKRADQLSQYVHSSTQQKEKDNIISVGNLHIAPEQYQVWISEKSVNLSVTEFKLLEYLARKPNQTIPHEELIQVSHDLSTDRVEAGSLLRPLIRSIRRKFGYKTGDMGCIQSVRGVGYMLIPP